MKAQVTTRETQGTALAAEALVHEMEQRAQTYVRMRDTVGSVLDAEHGRQRMAWTRRPPDEDDGGHTGYG
jgi:hypothetical protein